jgi:FAD:protein FMN transferase
MHMRLMFALLCGGLAFSPAGRAATDPGSTSGELARYEYAQPQMGVPFRIVLYATDDAKARAAAVAAFARVRQLNSILSDYDPDSELSQLSQSSGSAQEIRVGDDLWNVLVRAQSLAEKTGGAFDITVGPSVTLWRKVRRLKQMPPPDVIENFRKAVGFQHLKLHPSTRTASLLFPEMRLDLGGIGKGYAVDEAMKVLKSHGITRALVGADGDILVSDPPPGQEGWRIEVVNPRGEDKTQSLLLKNAAISTSGDLSQYVELDGRRYSHVVDPRTGVGLTDQILVSVIASESMTADSLATAISVLGPERGLELIASTPGTDARIARPGEAGLEVSETDGFRRLYQAGK